MADLSVQVSKLGHELEEIRLRALHNILKKLECGLLSPSILLDQDKLFEKLVGWFYFENAPEPLTVLKLINQLLKVNGGVKLLLRADPDLKHLNKISCNNDVSRSLLKKINAAVGQGVQQMFAQVQDQPVESEASPIVVNYNESPSTLARGSPSVPISIQCPTARSNDSSSNRLNIENSSFRIWTLPWHQLVKSDVNVLTAVESSLNNYDSVEHSCQFFSNVMLQDFPVEVFLQRHGIVKCLLNLLDKRSFHAVNALNELVKRLENRLLFFFDPATSCLKLEIPGNTDAISSYNSSPLTSAQRDSPVASDIRHQYQREGYQSNTNIKSTLSSGAVEQLSVPQFCSLLLKTVAPFCGKLEGIAAPLIPRTLKLLLSCLHDSASFWSASDPISLSIQNSLRITMINFAKGIFESVLFDPIERLLMISSTCLFLKSLVPLSIASTIVPQDLQKALMNLLLDPPIYVLYKKLHLEIVSYVQCFQKNVDPRYEMADRIHKAMQCALKFMRVGSNLPHNEFVTLFKDSMSGLLLHKQLEVIDMFVRLCSEKLNGQDTEEASSVIVQLLAHVDPSVSKTTYSACHKLVSIELGPSQAISGYDPYPKVRFILNSNVLKEIVCHGMMNQDIRVKEQAEEMIILILKCKMMLSYSSWMNVWSEISTVIPLLQGFSGSEELIGNTVMEMFNPDVAKRLGMGDLQILSSNLRLLFSPYEPCRKEASARLMWLVGIAIQDKSVRDICLVDRSVSGKQKLAGIYEPGSIVRVLDLLNRSKIHEHETVHDAALTQLSVMTDDPFLHEIFLENGGIDTVLRLLNSLDGSKEEKKILLPAVAILKNITRYCSKIRLQLCQDLKFLKVVLKGLFNYRKDWRLQRDATQLLAFLAFAEYYITTKGSISLPYIILVHFRLPFKCVAHWKVSPNSQPSADRAALCDSELKALLSVLWLTAIEDDVMRLDQPPPQVNPELTVSKQVLRQLQGSCSTHNCKKSLYAIHDAVSHNEVLCAIPKLRKSLEVCFLRTEKKAKIELDPAWRLCFYKFVAGFPNNYDDEKLLCTILNFLNFLAVTLKSETGWITLILNSSVHPSSRLLTSFSSSVDEGLIMWKELCIGVFDLARVCIDTNLNETNDTNRWNQMTERLLRCLHHTHTQHFYNLAFLGKALDTLTRMLHLKYVTSDNLKCGVLWELLSAFHCGTPQSCMGLGITRQTILVLVNMLHLDMKHKKNGKWEEDWVKEEYFVSLVPLFQSKDVVIRAAAFQLLCGLCVERHVCLVVMETLPDLWIVALRSFLDHNEASLVREQAILLCACIVNHDKKEFYVTSIGEHEFYHNLKIILNNLVMEQVFWDKYTFLISDDIELENVPTTPGLVKSACQLILNLLSQFTVIVGNDLRDSGVVQLLMRCLTRKSKSESTVRKEVGEMYSSVCSVLCNCLNKNVSVPTDLLPSLCRLFNEDLYEIQNKAMKERLWGKLLVLMSVILHYSESSFNFPSNVVFTLCFALSKSPNVKLQLHALQSVPGLTPSFTQDDCQQVCCSLISIWEKLIPTKRKEALLNALTALLGHSQEASLYALKEDLLGKLIYRFRNILVTLTVETGDTSRLKKGNPTLTNLCLYLGLSCNFMSGSPEVKVAAANVGFADILHKLWVWCLADSSTHIMSLKTLITFTADNPSGARSLVLTSTVSGVGQRKTPSAFSLVHALVAMIIKEHCTSDVFEKAFMLLVHACQASEARAVVAKSNLLSKFMNLSQQKRSPSEEVEGVWLKFLNVFTFYPDGQMAVSKLKDVIEQLIEYTSCSKTLIRITALSVLRNIAFHPSNRPRLLSSEVFLNLLCDKLVSNSTVEEKSAVALIVWALAANNQKAKLCLRGVGIDSRLQLAAAMLSSDNPAVELLDFTFSILVQSR